MLFKRYANPMPLVDGMIRTHRFTEFVDEFITATNKDTEDQTLWELWLHKIYDKDYGAFLQMAKPDAATSAHRKAQPTKEDLEKIVKSSMLILNDFCPS